MSTSINKQDNVLRVILDRRFDTNTAPDVDADLAVQLADDCRGVVFDFAHTDFMSSAGLRILLKTAKMLHAKGGKVAVCSANKQIFEVLESSGFLGILPHFSSIADATESIQKV